MRLAGLLLFFFAINAFGQEEGKLEFRDVAEGLRCPTCTGLSVLESDAKFSTQIKDEVQEQLDKGRSKDEIYKFFVERYGPWILREPPKEGFNFFTWAFPIGLLVFGLGNLGKATLRYP